MATNAELMLNASAWAFGQRPQWGPDDVRTCARRLVVALEAAEKRAVSAEESFVLSKVALTHSERERERAEKRAQAAETRIAAVEAWCDERGAEAEREWRKARPGEVKDAYGALLSHVNEVRAALAAAPAQEAK
jgi:hypothetical protein